MALKHWILAARPKTLPAAVMPVVVGSALAYTQRGFNWLPALLCLAFALLVQVATNFANDYFDHKSGADTAERLGPQRACASGWIAPEVMWRATQLMLAVAFVVGCGLIPFGGWWLVLVGLASLVSAIAYTGGPWPLGYNGFGDLFVIVFFGFVAVLMTTYVQAATVTLEAFWLGLGVGLCVNNLLVVNNVRDFETDQKAGKRTLVVLLGRGFGLYQAVAGLWVPVVVTLAVLWARNVPVAVGTVVLLVGAMVVTGIKRLPQLLQGAEYARALKLSASYVSLYGLLTSAGLLLATA